MKMYIYNCYLRIVNISVLTILLWHIYSKTSLAHRGKLILLRYKFKFLSVMYYFTIIIKKKINKRM